MCNLRILSKLSRFFTLAGADGLIIRQLSLEWTHYVFQDGDCQRLFVAHTKEQEDKPERIMLCTYPFERVTKEIFSSSKVLFDYFLYTSTNFFEELRAKYEK